MKVKELIKILMEMDQELEVVVPDAPYGHPRPVDGVIKMTITGIEDCSLDGDYVGIGFEEGDEMTFTDYLETHPVSEEWLVSNGWSYVKKCPFKGVPIWVKDKYEHSFFGAADAFVYDTVKHKCTCFLIGEYGITKDISSETHLHKFYEDNRARHFDDLIPKTPDDFLKIIKD
jgi:hypothetical protein